jgi:hypothetical protein
MMDVTVLQDAARKNFKHFCKCVDSGTYVSTRQICDEKALISPPFQRDQFYYLIMSLVGKSLHDLRKVSRISCHLLA